MNTKKAVKKVLAKKAVKKVLAKKAVKKATKGACAACCCEPCAKPKKAAK